ncbi:hypothetical protein B0H13DRAFT_1898511 [Mycena leptocephala]|nr:hypothetical protein B0H13DRAFT_1898511 [Mycena leptocephala]
MNFDVQSHAVQQFGSAALFAGIDSTQKCSNQVNMQPKTESGILAAITHAFATNVTKYSRKPGSSTSRRRVEQWVQKAHPRGIIGAEKVLHFHINLALGNHSLWAMGVNSPVEDGITSFTPLGKPPRNSIFRNTPNQELVAATVVWRDRCGVEMVWPEIKWKLILQWKEGIGWMKVTFSQQERTSCVELKFSLPVEGPIVLSNCHGTGCSETRAKRIRGGTSGVGHETGVGKTRRVTTWQENQDHRPLQNTCVQKLAWAGKLITNEEQRSCEKTYLPMRRRDPAKSERLLPKSKPQVSTDQWRSSHRRLTGQSTPGCQNKPEHPLLIEKFPVTDVYIPPQTNNKLNILSKTSRNGVGGIERKVGSRRESGASSIVGGGSLQRKEIPKRRGKVFVFRVITLQAIVRLKIVHGGCHIEHL